MSTADKSTTATSDRSRDGSAATWSTFGVSVQSEEYPTAAATFYERWNYEISSLRDRLDRQLQSMMQASQQEIDKVAAAVTGNAITDKSNSNGGERSSYQLSCVGPKLSPRTPKEPKGTLKKTNDPKHRIMLKKGREEIPHVFSGTSERTGKSDRTVPKSNLTRHVDARRLRSPHLKYNQEALTSFREEEEDAVLRVRKATDRREASIVQNRDRRKFFPGSYGEEKKANDSDSDIYVEDEAVNQVFASSTATFPASTAPSPKSKNRIVKRLLDPVLERRKGRNESRTLFNHAKQRDAPTTLNVSAKGSDSLHCKPDPSGNRQKLPVTERQMPYRKSEGGEKGDDSRASKESSSVQRKMQTSKAFSDQQRQNRGKSRGKEVRNNAKNDGSSSCKSKGTSSSSLSSHDNKGAEIVLYEKDRQLQPMMNQVIRLQNVTKYPITDPYGDKGLYTGVLIRGKPDSHGTMQYKDGRTYTGEWQRGRWHGQGKTIFANGDVYTGEYHYDKREGVGRYEWSDGRVYDGRFETDQRRGSGVYSWPDGSVYTGEFRAGLRHGSGSYTFADGSVYTGEFKNGKHDGIGECVWSDGRCYRGEWVEGRAHGYGVEVRADGSIRHDGEWRYDKPVRKSNKKKHSNRQGNFHHTTDKGKGKKDELAG